MDAVADPPQDTVTKPLAFRWKPDIQPALPHSQLSLLVTAGCVLHSNRPRQYRADGHARHRTDLHVLPLSCSLRRCPPDTPDCTVRLCPERPEIQRAACRFVAQPVHGGVAALQQLHMVMRLPAAPDGNAVCNRDGTCAPHGT